ncbi:MAG: hypothetical protein HC927_06070 [Deltaproteobacteria bacterium]|nr:hypothetical protein [Deltaproteobacteria bacterium]
MNYLALSRSTLALVCLAPLLGACASGEDDGRNNSIFTTSTTNSGDMDSSDELEDEDESSDSGEDSGDTSSTSTDGTGSTTTSDTGMGMCGDGIKQLDEECDGNDLGGLTCLDFGFQQGTLICADDCTLFDQACSTCGDGQLSPTEACDGNNFGGLTCSDLGYVGGTLSCAGDCSQVLESNCMEAPDCGNGVIDGGEACDGGNLNGQTCVSLGFDGGVLSCTAGCIVDTNGCTVQECAPLLSTCNLILNDCCEGLECIPVFGCLPQE